MRALADVVEAAPQLCSAQVRGASTQGQPVAAPCFRILSYNLLADQYAGEWTLARPHGRPDDAHAPFFSAPTSLLCPLVPAIAPTRAGSNYAKTVSGPAATL